MDEQSDYRKLKQATEAATRIQREIGLPKDPTPNETPPDPLLEPSPVQVGDDAVALNSSHVSAAALHLMDELERLRVENLGLQSRVRDLRAQVRRHEDWHIFGRCGQRWSEGEDDGDGRMISVFGPDDGFASYATNDRELWGVIEALDGAKEGDESIDETARRVCNPEIHAQIRDGVRPLMLWDLIDGLKERGFPDPTFQGNSVADAILRSIDERIDDLTHRAEQAPGPNDVIFPRETYDRLFHGEKALRFILNGMEARGIAVDRDSRPEDIAGAVMAAIPSGEQAAKVERDKLEDHIGELYQEMEAKDRTLGQLADIAEERDNLLVRVETLEQQIQHRRNPMQSDAPPGTWRGEESPPYDVLVRKYDVLVQKVVSLEAKMAGIPVDAEHLDRIGRRFEAHASRLDKIESLLAGDDTSWSKLVNHVANLQMEVDAFKRFEEQSDVPVEIQRIRDRRRIKSQDASFEAMMAGMPDDSLGRSKALNDAMRRIARLEALLCGEEGSGTEMLEEVLHSDEDLPSYRQVITEVAEVKNQFGMLVGIVELDGKVIRDHAERLGKIEELFGGHAERIKKLLEQSTPKSWWRR